MSAALTPEKGPAFPVPNTNDIPQEYQGMSLRDYFAGQALAGWSESHHVMTDGIGTYAEQIARVCAAVADAMLAERAK